MKLIKSKFENGDRWIIVNTSTPDKRPFTYDDVFGVFEYHEVNSCDGLISIHKFFLI